MNLRMEFLYFGAMIVVAAVIQGNPLAGFLACLAIVLTFVSVKVVKTEKRRDNSLFSLSSFEERKKRDAKNRASRSLATTENRNMNEKKLREMEEKAGALIGEVVQTGMHAFNKGGEPLGAIRFGLNTAMSAVVAVAPFLADRSKLDELPPEERNISAVLGLINTETMLFGALVMAKMFGGLKVEDENARSQFNNEKGVLTSGKVNFGLSVLSEAVEDWTKLTGKNPADFLDHGMLEAIANQGKDTLGPLEEFLKERASKNLH